MSRTINMGDHSQYVEKAKTAVQHNVSGGKASIPESISSQQWEEFISFMDRFLSSKEAESLSVENYKKLGKELAEAKRTDHSSGWHKFRDFLNDSANVTTILAPIASFVAANNNQILQWIQGLFR